MSTLRYLSELICAELDAEVKQVKLSRALLEDPHFDIKEAFGLLDTHKRGYFTFNEVSIYLYNLCLD